MSCSLFYIGNSNVIELQTLTNSATEVVDTGATVTVTMKDSAGEDVVGDTWPLAMTHVSAGLYRATMDDGLVLDHHDTYTAFVEAAGSGGEVGHWECDIRAENRKCK
jgi:hypothetical protein